MEAGDDVLALQALATRERRLVGKLARTAIRLIELGEGEGRSA